MIMKNLAGYLKKLGYDYEKFSTYSKKFEIDYEKYSRLFKKKLEIDYDKLFTCITFVT